MSYTRLNRKAAETVSITTSYPSGTSGTIRCFKDDQTVVIEFDGFKTNVTSWTTVASGFPTKIGGGIAWMAVTGDNYTMKLQVHNGALRVRQLSSSGTTGNYDVTAAYICA